VKSAFLYSEYFGNYKLAVNHPFDPVRGRKVYELCNRYGLLSHPGMEVVEPRPIAFEELAEIHSGHYLELLRRASAGEFYLGMLEYGIGTDDCPVFPGLLEFLALCAGASVRGGELVMDEGFRFAFNPLGGFHHAMRANAEGFCYINDIALVARRWADRGLKVAVVDIDAHHGNGTQDFFYHDPRVLTISFHESGQSLYPYGGEPAEIGEGAGRGYNVNVPMLAMSDDEIFLFAFSELLPPLLQAFAPDVVIGVVGVDTFATDPLTHLRLTNNAYVLAIKAIHKLAPRWLALGAGGYNMDNVARGWTLMWAAVHGLDVQDDTSASLGGVFIGDTDIGLAGLRDMNARTSGPDKARAMEAIDTAVDYIKDNVFPILGAHS
jgi:acetoin utilization protein AcuC